MEEQITLEVFSCLLLTGKYGFGRRLRRRLQRRKIMCKFIQLPFDQVERWKILFFQPYTFQNSGDLYQYAAPYSITIKIIESEVTVYPIPEPVPIPYTYEYSRSA